jgi:hypothetical protein
MIERCSIRDCVVQRDSDSKEPQPSLFSFSNIPIKGLICEEHYRQWACLQFELPMAIQELHALALLFPGEKGMPSLGGNVVTLIAMAVARVGRLRALEAFLKGE